MGKKNETLKYAAVAGLAMAVLSIVPELDWLRWIAIVVGLGIGIKLVGDVKSFLAVLVLTAFAIVLTFIPNVGVLFGEIFTNIAYFMGAMMVFPALKVGLRKVGIKF